MKKSTQSGFGLIEGLLAVVLLIGLGVVGYTVYKTNQDNKKVDSSSVANQTPPPTIKTFSECKAATGSKILETFPEQCVTKNGKTFTDDTVTDLAKTYSNSEYGFSFKYPTGWTLHTNLQDIGRGQEGDIYVQSPRGTKVHFAPNFGGKGGDCGDPQAHDQHTTRTCTTRDILSATKLPNSGSQPIWLVTASDTAPTDIGGKTTYFVFLASADYNQATNRYDVPPTPGSTLGVFLGTYDDVQLSKVALSVSVEGKDDNQNKTSAFFSTAEVKEALPILNSLNIR
ncbi:MAG TPA: hypothetical protein VG604_04160 [Candidatus Saccharimonadales bacterium]|nr:hypothetical protein [Candidatus Saccharimonadales bacterium]